MRFVRYIPFATAFLAALVSYKFFMGTMSVSIVESFAGSTAMGCLTGLLAIVFTVMGVVDYKEVSRQMHW